MAVLSEGREARGVLRKVENLADKG